MIGIDAGFIRVGCEMAEQDQKVKNEVLSKNEVMSVIGVQSTNSGSRGGSTRL
jgi:hypothetical protein